MYDTISEKFCDYNLKWAIDIDLNQTDILIIDKKQQTYHITIPTARLSPGDIFEIANDFVKIVVIHTYVNVSEYF